MTRCPSPWAPSLLLTLQDPSSMGLSRVSVVLKFVACELTSARRSQPAPPRLLRVCKRAGVVRCSLAGSALVHRLLPASFRPLLVAPICYSRPSPLPLPLSGFFLSLSFGGPTFRLAAPSPFWPFRFAEVPLPHPIPRLTQQRAHRRSFILSVGRRQ